METMTAVLVRVGCYLHCIYMPAIDRSVLSLIAGGGGTTFPVADDPDWSSQTSDDGIEPRDVYQRIWADENPRPEETGKETRLIVEVRVRKPIIVRFKI